YISSFLFLITLRPPHSTLFPYTTLFRSRSRGENLPLQQRGFSPGSAFPAPSVFESLPVRSIVVTSREIVDSAYNARHCAGATRLDRKSTRLNSSHVAISYAVFCLKKKTT